MQIIDYFQDQRQAHWLEQIAQYEWRAAKFLAQLLKEGTFHQAVGKGTLLLLADGDRLASFASLAERDCVDAPYGPWIGFVHTAPEYRGQHCAGVLLKHALHLAGQHGAEQVYICTDHVGLYEKYGFTYLENRVSIYGEDSRIYTQKTRSFRIEKLREDMLSALFAYEEQLSREEPGYYTWTENADYQQKVRNSFTDSRFTNAMTLVAITEDGTVVGRMDVALLPTHFDGSINAYLDWISVLKSWRHRGVAQALMQAMRDELHQQGIDTLVGLIAANPEAQRFYRSMTGAIIRDEGIWSDC